MALFKLQNWLGLNVLLSLFVLANLTHQRNYRNGGGWPAHPIYSDEQGQNQGERAFGVVTGPITDDNESDEQNQYPWRHHVDFDELHPGEDQIAMETVDREPRRMHFPEEHEQPLFGNDDLISPMFGLRPQIRQQSQPQPQPGVDLREWLNFMGFIPGDPWWKGSNVCMKREEEEETKEDERSNVDESDSIVNSTRNMEAPEFHMQFSACDDLDTRHSCITKLFGPKVTKTIKTQYECCHGYALDSMKSKCDRARYENIARTIEAIGGREFIRLVESANLKSKLDTQNLTVFVPSNNALASFLKSNPVETNDIEFIPEVEPKRRRRSILMHRRNEPGGRNVRRHNNRPEEHREQAGEPEYPLQIEEQVFNVNDFDWKRNALDQHDQWTRNHLVTYDHDENSAELQQTLLSHMVEGSLSTDDFVDEKVLYSENKDSVIRLNTWKVGTEKVKTVNCARLTSVNHKCTNGMVHMVDKMFKPVTKTIADIVSSNPDLSMLKTLLSSSDLMTMFRKQGNFTLFAPSNSAFDKVGHSLLFKMRSGDPCLKRILRHHILPITFCSSIVYSEGEVRNIDHEILSVRRNADDKLFINGSQILFRDIVTTNGVIHVVDAVIMSENDRPASQALEKSGLTTFLSYMNRCGIILDEMSNVTIFGMKNEVLATLPQEVVRDSNKLCEVMSFHIATPEIRACHFSHEQQLPTKLNGKSIRINVYSSYPFGTDAVMTAQCGRVTTTNNVACNGIIHEVDQVLLPPQLDLIETLKTQSDFAIFTRLIVETNLVQEYLRNSDDTVTVFAPTDAAFYDLPKEEFEKILSDPIEAARVVKRHITKESLCCAGIVPNVWLMTKSVATLGGSHIPIYRDPNGQVLFGGSKVTTCDLTASNAIIHTVNSVLSSKSRYVREEQLGACLPETLEKMDIRALFFRL